MAWKSMDTIPKTGDFMIAEYAPMNYEYRCIHISPPAYLEGEQREAYVKRHIRWARAWRPLVPEPTKIPGVK